MPLHVDEKTLRELGFGEILSALVSRAATPRGRAKAAKLDFLRDRQAIATMQRRIAQGRAVLGAGERLPVAGTDDVQSHLERAEKGAVLPPEDLLACARAMRAAAQVRAFLRVRRQELLELATLGEGLVDLGGLAGRIEYAIEPSGRVRDEASDVLAAHRRRARGLHGHIQTRVEELLRDSQFQSYLQDSYFSVRNDRYVLPVNASFRAKVPGIVHNASQTGLTLFIEPQEVVDLGNELAIAQALALEEERRILGELSESVGDHATELERSVEVLAQLDVVQAAAELAGDMDANPAELTAPGDGFTITALRHPLLVLQKKRVVPNDVVLHEGELALVVSGPNAGGKTVTLTAVGLAVLMTRAGLWVPAAAGSRVPLYDGLASTIGDAQDLLHDLSTFSAHLTALRDVLAKAREGWLVLVDEIAADTDPAQGAALACSILEELVSQGARVLVTTHLDEVKALGLKDSRFKNARVGLDPETLAPTYKLELGAAGGSNALQIAVRVGLPSRVVERARESLAKGSLLSEAIGRLETTEREVAGLRERLTSERAELERLLQEQAAAHQELTVARREVELRVRAELATELGARREEVTRLIAELQAKPTMAEAQRAQKRLAELETEQEQAQARLEVPRDTPPSAPVSVGGRVQVVTLGKEGRVLSIEGKSALVEVGALHTRVKLTDLVGLKGEPSKKSQQPKAAAPAVLTSQAHKLDVRGLRADDAMREIEAFLDRCYLEGPSVVILVHGHGTGALKQMVREALEKSPYVERHRPGGRHEGGDGATVVELRQ